MELWYSSSTATCNEAEHQERSRAAPATCGFGPRAAQHPGVQPPPSRGPRDTAVPSRPHAWYVAAGTRSGTEDPLGTAVPWPTPALLPPGASALTPGARWSICACRALQHQMGSPVTRGPCHRLGTSSRGRRREAEGWEQLPGGVRHPPPLGGCPSPQARGSLRGAPWMLALGEGARAARHQWGCATELSHQRTAPGVTRGWVFSPLALSPLTTLGIALCLLLLHHQHQPGCCAARWDTAPPRPAPLLQ